MVDVTALVAGHTPVERLTSLDNVLYIDTGAGFPDRNLNVDQLAPELNVVLREVVRVPVPTLRLEGSGWYEGGEK